MDITKIIERQQIINFLHESKFIDQMNYDITLELIYDIACHLGVELANSADWGWNPYRCEKDLNIIFIFEKIDDNGPVGAVRIYPYSMLGGARLVLLEHNKDGPKLKPIWKKLEKALSSSHKIPLEKENVKSRESSTKKSNEYEINQEDVDKLSDLQIRIFYLIGQGLKNRKILDELMKAEHDYQDGNPEDLLKKVEHQITAIYRTLKYPDPPGKWNPHLKRAIFEKKVNKYDPQ
jgi:hypothetical protein